MASGNQQSRTHRTLEPVARVQTWVIIHMTKARHWRARHPLGIDMIAVVAALVVFALLLADRQRLVDELTCTTSR
jgi:hypothetical protein